MKRGFGITGNKLPSLKEQGFTLLELLVSVGLLSIIIAIIAGAAQLGHRAMSSGEKKMDSAERLRTSLRLINAQVQSQLPLAYDDENGRHVYFSGSRESLRFPTAYSLWGQTRGYVFVSYAVETDSGGRQFIRVTETPQALENRQETRLFEGLDACSFAYFSKDSTGEHGTWTDQWTETMSIPEKIRIRFSMGQREYAMIIPVRANTPQQPSGTAPRQQQVEGFMGPF